jgi:HSP20 family protein
LAKNRIKVGGDYLCNLGSLAMIDFRQNMFIFQIISKENLLLKEVIEMMRMFNVVPRYNIAFRPKTRLLDRFFSDWMMSSTYLDEGDWTPASDIAETETQYHVTMELPGIDMQNLDISFSEGILTVKGEKAKEVSIGESCYCSERFSGSFQRSFQIPGTVDQEKIEANYKDGILKVSLAKSEESGVKKIEIH